MNRKSLRRRSVPGRCCSNGSSRCGRSCTATARRLTGDVWDEIAGLLATTVGAVKAALHRGRERLRDPVPRPARATPDRSLVDALVEAFDAYDPGRVAALFLADGVSEMVGVFHEQGRDRVRTGALHATLVGEQRMRYHAEARELAGEPILLLWETDGAAPPLVGNVLRVESRGGRVARLRWYFFCPETVAEVAEHDGLPYRTHGYSGAGCAAHR